MRPANIITAIADIIAGISISGILLTDLNNGFKFFLLILATIGLYGGGVVLNDVCDAELDKIERPERPIPKGVISVKNATLFAAILFLIAVTAAFAVSFISGIIALGIVFFASIYDKWAKHHVFFGPLFMGTCRALNLLLGISASLDALQRYWPFSIIPLVFISAITLLSQGEVHGSSRINFILSGALFLMVFTLLNTFPLSFGQSIKFSFPISLLFLFFVLTPYIKAFKSNNPLVIRAAVKAGVLSLIISDATLVAAFSNVFLGLLLLLLLPLSVFLAKTFAVT